MVKNRVMLSGILVAGLMGAQVQASDYVDKVKAPLAFFAGASAARNSIEWALGQRRAGLGFPLAGYNVQKRVVTAKQSVDGSTLASRSEHTARMLRVGSYSVGVRTSNDAQTLGQKVMGLRPAFDGFTLGNVAKDAFLGAALLYGVQKGYLPVPSIPGLSK